MIRNIVLSTVKDPRISPVDVASSPLILWSCTVKDKRIYFLLTYSTLLQNPYPRSRICPKYSSCMLH